MVCWVWASGGSRGSFSLSAGDLSEAADFSAPAGLSFSWAVATAEEETRASEAVKQSRRGKFRRVSKFIKLRYMPAAGKGSCLPRARRRSGWMGAGRRSRATATAAEQVDGRTELKERVIGRLNSVDARYGVEDDVLLLACVVGCRLGESYRTEFKDRAIGGAIVG